MEAKQMISNYSVFSPFGFDCFWIRRLFDGFFGEFAFCDEAPFLPPLDSRNQG